MAFEKGGRADKLGNRYENYWVITKLLEIIEEKLSYVSLEAIGEDEEGVDVWTKDINGNIEAQQCKARYGSDESWDFGTINRKKIWANWKKHLERDNKTNVSLVSPLAFTNFCDIHTRAMNNNGSPKDFVEIQIGEASKKIQTLFKKICKAMGLDLERDKDKELALNYFQRMHYRQFGDSVVEDILKYKIERYFCGDAKIVRDILLNFILNEDIYGKKITLTILDNYLREQGVIYRNLSKDERITPRINAINEEYEKSYQTFSSGLIQRSVSCIAWKQIKKGESIIIHGKAGVGKSGCSAEIVSFCKKEIIPYISIKLDKHVPNHNTKTWSEKLGLPASISYCLDSISKESFAIIILDQLDALRWTQAHSRNSLDVCMEIIKEVNLLNKERKDNISIIFICRTYDLENDTEIKQLFNPINETNIKWNKVEVNELDDKAIKIIVGEEYNTYPNKIKKLIKTASNLYIWEKLDKTKDYFNIKTTFQLINEWWDQISINARQNNLDTTHLKEIKNKFVDYCDRKGCIAIHQSVVDIPADYKAFLISSGFMVQSESKLSFAHQSILDYFLAEKMFIKYNDGEDISKIIGSKDKQTPGRIYQVQIFLQQVLEDSVRDFICIGKQILKMEEIRYSIKFVFITLLSQIREENDSVWKFVKELLSDSSWKEAIISYVIMGNIGLVHNIRECGLLDQWYINNPNLVIKIMKSIAPNYNKEELDFIRKYALEGKGDSNWDGCFGSDINEGLDEYFELRLDFYKRFPNSTNKYLDFREMFSVCGIRTIRILLLFMELNAKNQGKACSKYVEDLLYKEVDIIVDNYNMTLDYLLPVIPKTNEEIDSLKWGNKFCQVHTIERVVMLIVKLANKRFAQFEPEKFWNRYQYYMGAGNNLYNEIILDGFQYLPDIYADRIIEYLYSDFGKNAVEQTSGNGNMLLSSSLLIKKFSGKCSKEIYKILENRIIKYTDSKAKRILSDRIKENKKKRENGYYVYSRYWGDLQSILLPALDESKRSKEVDELIQVLANRDKDYENRYNCGKEFEIHTVTSTISGKRISSNSWLKIIANLKIRKRKFELKNECYIVNSLEDFQLEFRKFISSESMEIVMKKFVNCDSTLDSRFVNSLLSGIANNPKLDEVSNQEIESAILKYGYDMQSDRADYICEIIKNKQDTSWSTTILDILIKLVLNPEGYSMKSSIDNTELTIRNIEANMLNCTSGKAIYAIKHLLEDGKTELFGFFKDTIKRLSDDESVMIRYFSLSLLQPAYEYDSKWAVGIIMELFRNNFKFLGFQNSKWILCRHYLEYEERINISIIDGINCEDERVNCECGYVVAEIYMLFNAFSDILYIYKSANKSVKKCILEMTIKYVSIQKYRDKAIDLLGKLIEVENDKENDSIWAKLFQQDILKYSEDKVLIRKILISKISRRILSYFYDYVCRNGSIKEYADDIINISENIIKKEVKQEAEQNYYIRELYTVISKLIIGLYDEVSSCDTDEKYEIANRCLDIWDFMYEKNIGIARVFSNQIMELY